MTVRKRSKPKPSPLRGGTHHAATAFWIAGGAACLYALSGALRHRWVSDDAFISFRYADHFAHGLGLVYNPGEHVEGYSNFLWTLYNALGLRLGADVEGWALAGSALSYLASLALLIGNAWILRPKSGGGAFTWIPIAGVLGALHPDWQIFATSGLETSLFTLLVTSIYTVLSLESRSWTRPALTGMLVGIASMTRPEGMILVLPAGLSILLTSRRRIADCSTFLAVFALIWTPYTLWRVSYFGDFFPNTYYAKSAGLAWYSQGACYVALYFLRYWPLVLGLVLALVAWRNRSGAGQSAWNPVSDPWQRRVVSAALLLLVELGFVLRVGGDFMFARFLIPVTPLLLAILELAILDATPGSRGSWPVAGLAAAGILFTPYPLPRDPRGDVRGIVFEPNYYSRDETERTKREGIALRPFLEGLDAQVAFSGADARLMYYARPRVAIETATGLTDREIARQPLTRRGRIGHEKQASIAYLLENRHTQLATPTTVFFLKRLKEETPRMVVTMDGVSLIVLTWDSELMDSLRQRGAQFVDFPTELDRVLADPRLRAGALRQPWFTEEKLRRFYFAQTPDPLREARVREALGGR